MANLIAPGKNLGHSHLYIDFLAGNETARSFYPANDLGQVAQKLDSHKYEREKITQILLEQNKLYQASEKTFANIEKLQSPHALAVFSGQQAVLFGGPMLILIKALSLVKTADALTLKLNRPVVPIFWIAGDDHDFEEANHTLVLNRQTEEINISYNNRPALELPTAEIEFENAEALDFAKSLYKESLGDTEFTDKLYDLIDTAYKPGETIVSAFGILLAGLTAEFGLVLFSPGDKAVKSHSSGFFRELINKQRELHEITAQTNREILKKGYHLQVEKAENSTHLFYNLKGRQPVLRDSDKFKVGDKSFTKDELLMKIETEPEKFSPDVLTRPVFQSYLFPVLTQLGGPAEIAYLAQSGPIFELFGLPAPVYIGRPSATFVEKHFEKMTDEYNISFEELTGDIEQVVNRVLAKSFPVNLEQDFEKLKRNIGCEFDEIKMETIKFDPALKEFAEQTFGKIDFALRNFQEKVFASHKRKSQEVRNRIYRLRNALFPARALQERSLNFGYFVAKYGFEFIKFMHDKIDINEKSHQLISLSDYQHK